MPKLCAAGIQLREQIDDDYPDRDRKSDGSVLLNAHEGEYVIPKRVVEMKGKEFFDTLVEKYKET